MAYRFALAPVLRVRELAAEEEERLLGRIHGEIERLRSSIAGNEHSLRQASESRSKVLDGAALAAMHLHTSYAASDELRVRGEQLREQLAKFEALREQQIARYRAAYQSREVLVSLRTADQGAWELAQSKREAKAADEAFLARRLRVGK